MNVSTDAVASTCVNAGACARACLGPLAMLIVPATSSLQISFHVPRWHAGLF